MYGRGLCAKGMCKMMRKVNFIFRIFAMVTTCTVFATAVFTNFISHAESLNPMMLWEIPAVSMLCALGTLIYPWDVSMSKKETGIRIFLHYLYINAVVLVSGWLFDWYNVKSFKSVLYMVISIALIFAVVSAFSWRHEAVEAKRMNERLQEYQKEKEEE